MRNNFNKRKLRTSQQKFNTKPYGNFSSKGNDVVPGFDSGKTRQPEIKYESCGKMDGTFDTEIGFSAKFKQKLLVIEYYKLKYVVSSQTSEIRSKAKLSQSASAATSLCISFLIALVTSSFQDIGAISGSFIRGFFVSVTIISGGFSVLQWRKYAQYKDVDDEDFVQTIYQESNL